VVRARELVGVWDSRFCGTQTSEHLYMFMFRCDRTDRAASPSLALHEVTDLGWFAEDELPPLSPGHGVRLFGLFESLRSGVPHFDATA
jgi:hypothetical protein